jgi:spore maturation protein CgeB
MYPEYLDSFHKMNPDTDNFSYDQHNRLLLDESTEFAGSYNRNFKKTGINAECIITNDANLQNKWLSERGIKSSSDIILEQIKKQRPEILWIESVLNLNAQWLRNIKNEVKSIKLIIAYHCAPYTPSILEKLRSVDFVITCTPGIKEDLETKGIRSYLVYHGFDSDLLSRIKVNHIAKRNNLVFSGSLFPGDDYHNARIAFIERLIEEKVDLSLYVNLEKLYKIKLKQSIYHVARLLNKLKLNKIMDNFKVFEYGKSKIRSYSKELVESNHAPLFGIEMYDLFNISDTVLNMHVGVAGDYAGNMRIFEVTGVGSCLLTDNKKNIGELFETDKEILVYNSTEDCLEKIKWLSDHEEERKKIADEGHWKTLKYHTVENRCKQIHEIISKELGKL